MTEPRDETRDPDGIDRRGFLECMAWAGTGMLWSVSGGVLSSVSLGPGRPAAALPAADLYFAQISDSHIGFSKDANPDVTATLQEAVNRVNALPARPAFVLHTGDISQLSKPTEFDTADQVIRGIRTDRVFYVPGEHDVLTDNGQQYRDRYGKGTRGNGWYSFDHSGVHFIGLVNVVDLKAGGLGTLGAEQLAWLKRDTAALSSSTPIVIFAHIPLWTVYADWGWGTDDSAQALALVRRFGSVTVLNGHIHQVVQKVEGNVTFHTANSTAFPQPAPGSAPSPGPMKVPADQLRTLLGIASVNVIHGRERLAVIDAPLERATGAAGRSGTGGEAASAGTAVAGVPAGAGEISIDNFAFTPRVITVPAGTTVTWTNADDVPHKIVSSDRRFPGSPALDTHDHYAHRFTEPGRYGYYCGLHPKMTGTIQVTK